MAKKTVLIVDDMVFVRQTLSDVLTQAGYQIVGEAASGSEAIKLYAQTRPDLVIMDVVMPEMSGIEATRQIVKMDRGAHIIILSAMDQAQLVMEAINAGARDYITKPFKPQELLKSVDHALADLDREARI